MKKENFFGLAIVLALCTSLPAEAFRFAAEAGEGAGTEGDAAVETLAETGALLSHGEKAAAGDDSESPSTRKDRQLGE